MRERERERERERGEREEEEEVNLFILCITSSFTRECHMHGAAAF
jgi:hypothetical protein